jgi:hypothetical protein
MRRTALCSGSFLIRIRLGKSRTAGTPLCCTLSYSRSWDSGGSLHLQLTLRSFGPDNNGQHSVAAAMLIGQHQLSKIDASILDFWP